MIELTKVEAMLGLTKIEQSIRVISLEQKHRRFTDPDFRPMGVSTWVNSRMTAAVRGALDATK